MDGWVLRTTFATFTTQSSGLVHSMGWSIACSAGGSWSAAWCGPAEQQVVTER